MSFHSSRTDEPLADINVTPLVDVLLVLLVVFLVMAPLLSHAIHIDLPKSSASGAEARDHAVAITLEAGGHVDVDGRVTGLAMLEPALRRIAAADPHISVNLRSDRSKSFGEVAQVLDIVGRAGIAHVSIATETTAPGIERNGGPSVAGERVDQ